MPYGSSGGGKKVDWHGACDGTPSSKPSKDLRDYDEPSKPRGDAWKGMDDGTPSSKPTKPADS